MGPMLLVMALEYLVCVVWCTVSVLGAAFCLVASFLGQICLFSPSFRAQVCLASVAPPDWASFGASFDQRLPVREDL